jgi:hypothetical protein
MMAERRMVVAGPVELVQGGVGVIGRTPIHVPDPEGPVGAGSAACADVAATAPVSSRTSVVMGRLYNGAANGTN